MVAANNASSDSAINWNEGMPPSAVNNSARQLEARVAEILADMGGALTAGGTANALTVTANSAFTAYADGLMLALRIATDNTTAATLNVNGLGAKSIRKMLAAGESALTGAELQATGIYLFRYSTALNSAAGGWLLLNPTFDATAFATLTGIETLTNKTLTGAVLNGTLGATTPSTIAATTISGTNGSFSGTLGVTGAVTLSSTLAVAGAATLSGAVSIIGQLTTTSGIASAGANLVIASTGAGSIIQRPNGIGSTTGQMVLSNTGAVTINGTLTVTG